MADPTQANGESNSGWNYSWQAVVSFMDAQVVGLEEIAPVIIEDAVSALRSVSSVFGAGVALGVAAVAEGYSGFVNEILPTSVSIVGAQVGEAVVPVIFDMVAGAEEGSPLGIAGALGGAVLGGFFGLALGRSLNGQVGLQANAGTVVGPFGVAPGDPSVIQAALKAVAATAAKLGTPEAYAYATQHPAQAAADAATSYGSPTSSGPGSSTDYANALAAAIEAVSQGAIPSATTIGVPAIGLDYAAPSNAAQDMPNALSAPAGYGSQGYSLQYVDGAGATPPAAQAPSATADFGAASDFGAGYSAPSGVSVAMPDGLSAANPSLDPFATPGLSPLGSDTTPLGGVNGADSGYAPSDIGAPSYSAQTGVNYVMPADAGSAASSVDSSLNGFGLDASVYSAPSYPVALPPPPPIDNTGGASTGGYLPSNSVGTQISANNFPVSYGGGSFGGGSYGPVILDLAGAGIKITQKTQSNQFFDMANDGFQHLTAWAGAGNAVLFYDPTGKGALSRADQVVFTDLDPSAKNDMQALAAVFDSNHDGQLSSADAAYNDFFVEVTNANGTTSIESLAQAGISSINLTPNATHQALPDGSSIDGQTTFTVNGQTHRAATVTLNADSSACVEGDDADDAGRRLDDDRQRRELSRRRHRLRAHFEHERRRADEGADAIEWRRQCRDDPDRFDRGLDGNADQLCVWNDFDHQPLGRARPLGLDERRGEAQFDSDDDQRQRRRDQGEHFARSARRRLSVSASIPDQRVA